MRVCVREMIQLRQHAHKHTKHTLTPLSLTHTHSLSHTARTHCDSSPCTQSSCGAASLPYRGDYGLRALPHSSTCCRVLIQGPAHDSACVLVWVGSFGFLWVLVWVCGWVGGCVCGWVGGARMCTFMNSCMHACMCACIPGK